MAPKTRPDDDWGVGEQDDGTIKSMTEEQARVARAERDAENEVWNRYTDEGTDEFEEDLDDISDLDDPIP